MSDRTDGGLAWDTGAVRTQTVSLVTATATADAVVLSFGAQTTDYAQGHAALRTTLLSRIALRPASAKHLRDMLGQLAADLEKSSHRAG